MKQQSVGIPVAQLGHIIRIEPTNQSLFFLLNAAYLVGKQQIPII
jgi:hypothetical protein